MDRRLKSERLRGDNKIVLLQPQKQQRDISHTVIIALATIISALIVSKRI